MHVRIGTFNLKNLFLASISNPPGPEFPRYELLDQI